MTAAHSAKGFREAPGWALDAFTALGRSPPLVCVLEDSQGARSANVCARGEYGQAPRTDEASEYVGGRRRHVAKIWLSTFLRLSQSSV